MMASAKKSGLPGPKLSYSEIPVKLRHLYENTNAVSDQSA